MRYKMTRIPGGMGFLMRGMPDGGAGLSPNIWFDCPLAAMAVDPTLGITDGDDFTRIQATGFPYLLTGINHTAGFQAVAGQQYGQAKLVTAGADNDAVTITTNNNLAGLIKANATNQWWFEARVKLSQITLAQGVFVGLAEETGVSTDLLTTNTMALKVIDAIGFQVLAATDIAAVWQSIIQLTGGARVAVNSTLATGSTNFIKLGMRGKGSKVVFFVDGLPNSTTVLTSATNFPLDQVMQVTLATKAGQGTANTLTLDWWRAAQLR